jgi:predicted nucleic acid-binding protein
LNPPVVIDASAGVELLLNTSTGSALRAKLPAQAVEWVPEVYYADIAAVVRRAELAGRTTTPRSAAAITRILAAPLRRV